MVKKSVLQQQRAAYQPKLPAALWSSVQAVKGAPTQSVADQEKIKELFPNTYGLPELTFEKAAEAAAQGKAFNAGVILSGGQAPGGHNVISGLFDGLKALNPDNRLYGFLMGPGGLVDHNYVERHHRRVSQHRRFRHHRFWPYQARETRAVRKRSRNRYRARHQCTRYHRW